MVEAGRAPRDTFAPVAQVGFSEGVSERSAPEADGTASTPSDLGKDTRGATTPQHVSAISAKIEGPYERPGARRLYASTVL